VLVLRILAPLAPEDQSVLRAFAEAAGVQLWTQSAGPETVVPFWPEVMPPLYYSLPEFDVRIAFVPTDFTQVNYAVNRILVRRALALLDPRPGERVADFFCGLGNFALPMARSGARVIGYEGSDTMVARGRENAQANGLDRECRFEAANLFDRRACEKLGAFDKALIDPPREGAIEVVKSFSQSRPRRVVYVSCDPATLARDAGVLVNTQGYALRSAGIDNMFAHTSHVESLALFERD
jgi:23S rRNA (uracil1939-C5)-methyltransferase